MPTLDEAVETAAGTPEPEPSPGPQPVPEPVKAPEPAKPAEAPKPEPTPAAEDDASKLFLLTPKPGTPAPKPEETLTDEEKEKGYLRQADYTRKTQALAEERRAYAEREEKLLKLLESRLQPAREQEGETTVFEKIRQFREEGNHEEADKLMYELARVETRKELDPVIKNAKTQELQSVFVNTALQTAASDPVVQRYSKKVATRWDGNEVLDARTGLTMGDLRAAVITDPAAIQRFVPLIMRSLALEEHARALEAEMGKTVAERVKAGLEAEKARGKKLPGQLVPSSSVARGQSPAGKMSLDEALAAAEEQLSSGQ